MAEKDLRRVYKGVYGDLIQWPTKVATQHYSDDEQPDCPTQAQASLEVARLWRDNSWRPRTASPARTPLRSVLKNR